MSKDTELLFSVVIPCYNEESYIDKLLSSLEKQDIDSDKFEVIVVDNNSTDGTSQVVWDYAVYSQLNIRIIHEYTPGVSIARNVGSSVAIGNTIIFLDADNTLTDDFLSRLCEYISTKNCLAGSICTLPDEFDIKGWIIFSILELIKAISFKPFGKSFVNREIYACSNGFNERIVLGENVEFLQKIKKDVKRRGGKFGHLRPGIRCSLRRFKMVGYIKILFPWLVAYLGVYCLNYKTMTEFNENA